MSATRYYKVEDENTINLLREHIKLVGESHKKANEIGKKWGFENDEPAAFRRWGLWDSHLSGFYCTHSELANRPDEEHWIRIKDGTTRPRKNKKNPYWKEYSQLCKDVDTRGEEMEEAAGFNRMTFFPTTAGVYYSLDESILIFAVPESCDSLKGAKEISNIEYIKLTAKN